MRHVWIWVFVLGMATVLPFQTACIQKSEKTETEQATEQEQEEKKPGFFEAMRQIGKAAEAVKKTAEAAKKAQARKPVQPYHFRELLDLLPEPLPGWKKDPNRLDARTTRFGEWTYSYVEQTYITEDGKSEATVKITDGAFIPPLYAAFALASMVSEETMDHYRKGFEEDGVRGIREFHFKDHRGSIAMVVGDRFIVEITVRGVDRDDVLNAWERRVPIQQLHTMADQPGHAGEPTAER